MGKENTGSIWSAKEKENGKWRKKHEKYFEKKKGIIF